MKLIKATGFAILLFSINLQAENTNSPNTSKDQKPTKNLVIPEYEKPHTISGRFDKLIYNGYLTFIPKGTILHLPETHQSKINTSYKKVKQLSWHDFYMKNRNIIHVVPLTKIQTFGTKTTKPYEMPYKKFEDLKKLGRIVICTYNGKPVRVKVQPKPKK